MKIRRLLGLGGSSSSAETEAQRLLEHGDGLGAGRLLEEHGLLSQAADVYLVTGEYRAAAAVLTRLGRRDEALDASRRAAPAPAAPAPEPRGRAAVQEAQALAQRGNPIDAAKLYAQAGQWRQAADLYARAGLALRAADAYERAGDAHRAAQHYERHVVENAVAAPEHVPLDAADRQAALKAAQLYARTGQPDKALQLFVRGGHVEAAGDLARSLGRFKAAAELYARVDALAKAAEVWERAGEPVRAALARGELALRGGRREEAARHFLEGQDHYRAAELYESLGRPADAAAAYAAGGAFGEAGQAYLALGQRERAAAAFEQGGQLDRAAELYESLGQPGRAAALFEKAELSFRAGRAAACAGDPQKAIALLQRVEAGDEGYAEASELLLELFVAAGLPKLAIERAQFVLTDQPPSSANVGLHYWLAVCHEMLGDVPAAVALYQKVLAVDFAYRDVAARLQRLAPPGGAPARARPAAPAVRPPVLPSNVVPPSAEAAPRFTVCEALGRGPLGTVYRAEDRDGRSVALRVLVSDAVTGPVLRGLLGDLRPAARLSHSNLVKVIAVEERDGRPCVASELVCGTNMADFLRSRQHLSVKRCHALGRGLALALSFVHGKGLVHGSVRPSNVFVISGIVKLADLGLGPLFRVAVPPDAYRAPENRFDVAGDVFALGATLYHLLTGCEPPRSGGMPTLPPQPSDLVAGVPASVDRLLLRALDPRPEARFASAKEIVQALDAMVTIG